MGTADHELLNRLLAAVGPFVDQAAAALAVRPGTRALACITTWRAQVLIGFMGAEGPVSYAPAQPMNDAIGRATAELIELACGRSDDAAVIANLVAAGASFAVYVDGDLGRASVRLMVSGHGSVKLGELQAVLPVN